MVALCGTVVCVQRLFNADPLCTVAVRQKYDIRMADRSIAFLAAVALAAADLPGGALANELGQEFQFLVGVVDWPVRCASAAPPGACGSTQKDWWYCAWLGVVLAPTDKSTVAVAGAKVLAPHPGREGLRRSTPVPRTPAATVGVEHLAFGAAAPCAGHRAGDQAQCANGIWCTAALGGQRGCSGGPKTRNRRAPPPRCLGAGG